MKPTQYHFFLVSIILTIGVSSCGGDDDKKPTSVVGSWKEVSVETFDCPNTADNNLDECATTNNCETWKFNADGTFTRTTTTNVAVEGTYFMMGDQIRLCYTGCLDYDYTISGSTLTITEITAGNECVTRYKVSKI